MQKTIVSAMIVGKEFAELFAKIDPEDKGKLLSDNKSILFELK
jgi:hypothetical protein